MRKKIISVMVVSVITGLVIGGGIRPMLTSAVVPGDNTLISVNNSGNNQGGDSSSSDALISANGKFVAFNSSATNLVAGDTNGKIDVFIRSIDSSSTLRVSLIAAGTQRTQDSQLKSISETGRFVGFESNGDVFLYDRDNSSVEQINVNSTGQDSNYPASGGYVSNDGRFVAFNSRATNLGPAITTATNGGALNAVTHAFVRDRKLNTNTLLDQTSAGTDSNNDSYVSSISCDGAFIALYSLSSNLTTGDTNGKYDVFLVDRRGGYSIVNLTSGNDHTGSSTISCSGSYVAFSTPASNIISGMSGLHAYVYNRLTGEYGVVDQSTSGEFANDGASNPSVDDNGNVVFYSQSTNLVNDNLGVNNGEVYFRNTQNGTTELLSKNSLGNASNNYSTGAGISRDGRKAIFWSSASNLIPSDTNSKTDVFLARTGL